VKGEFGIEVSKASYLSGADDLNPFSKKEFDHSFMMVESYRSDLRMKGKEAGGLRCLSYNEIVEEGVVPMV